jgi:glycerol-3-phosphate dehydrogenase
VWAGLRPLAGAQSDAGKTPSATQNISREHTVKLATNGLVSVTGGKWTTYRAMAADVMQCIRKAHLLSLTAEDVTVHTSLWGAQTPAPDDPLAANDADDVFGAYGTDAPLLREIEGHDHWLSPHVSGAMIRFAARYEYARTVEDVLARRKRLLFLDAKEAAKIAPEVASLLEAETGMDAQLAAFLTLAETYQVRT